MADGWGVFVLFHALLVHSVICILIDLAVYQRIGSIASFVSPGPGHLAVFGTVHFLAYGAVFSVA